MENKASFIFQFTLFYPYTSFPSMKLPCVSGVLPRYSASIAAGSRSHGKPGLWEKKVSA